MTLRIEIYTAVVGGTYWLEFDTAEEQRATMAFLNEVTWGNDRKGEGRTPLYFIGKQEQQDGLDRFLRELGRAHPSGGSPRGFTPPPPDGDPPRR